MAGPDLKHAIEAGQELTEMSKARARAIADRLVEQGQARQHQAQSGVEDLLAASRSRAARLRAFVDARVQDQLRTLGVATRKDLEHLEKRVVKAERAVRAATKSSPARTAPRKNVVAAKAGTKPLTVNASATESSAVAT